MIRREISFGDLRIGPTARKYIDRALQKNWISEGDNVAEFEEKFAAKFEWKHAISTSSGTDAGIVVWSAIRELENLHHYAESRGRSDCKGHVITPACAFVATANVVCASGMRPVFMDINIDTLNLNPNGISKMIENYQHELLPIAGIQFVATIGKPTPIGQIAAIADERNLYLVSDSCEAHGAKLLGGRQYADHYADASIYSFFAAHLIVAGEGGMICTDDDEIADLCRSIKSHGYGDGSRFDFKTFGINSKWNDLCAAVGLESLERFDETFSRRRIIRQKMIAALEEFEDRFILYRDDPAELISPHAFPIVLRDENISIEPLYKYLQNAGIEVKTLFGSLPTQHRALRWIGHGLGEFPIAERIGRTGLHWGCHEYITDEDIEYIRTVIAQFYGA